MVAEAGNHIGGAWPKCRNSGLNTWLVADKTDPS
jgi:hypothetical protein